MLAAKAWDPNVRVVAFDLLLRHDREGTEAEVSVSLTIDDAGRLTGICDALREFSEVSVEKDQAIVCIVGDNLRHTPGVAARAFGAMQGINIRMISQGASLLNIGFVVAARDAERTVKVLHQEFFRNVDPAVFD